MGAWRKYYLLAFNLDTNVNFRTPLYYSPFN